MFGFTLPYFFVKLLPLSCSPIGMKLDIIADKKRLLARLRLEGLALKNGGRFSPEICSLPLTLQVLWDKSFKILGKTLLAAVGFEPTPPKRLVP